MKKYVSFVIAAAFLLLSSCSDGQAQSGSAGKLHAVDFAQRIKELPGAPVLDVRTPEEYSKGHLPNARNIDWNGNSFNAQIAELDKSRPVFVYCLSGGRSSAAAEEMRHQGFTEVYELSGGIMKWRAANLPETNTTKGSGMSRQQFAMMLNSDKEVLIDFYADWCEPCKRMKPYLDEISKDMRDKVVVIRINADENQSLCKELAIDALPVLQLYRNKTLAWKNSGYIDKAAVLNKLTGVVRN